MKIQSEIRSEHHISEILFLELKGFISRDNFSFFELQPKTDQRKEVLIYLLACLKNN